MSTDDAKAQNLVQEVVDKHLAALSTELDKVFTGADRGAHGPKVQAALLEALKKWVEYIEAVGIENMQASEPQPRTKRKKDK